MRVYALCDRAEPVIFGCAVIVESTYGVSKHLPRDQREQRFVEKVRTILMRGGRVLLPVVALGRAQVTNLPLSAPVYPMTDISNLVFSWSVSPTSNLVVWPIATDC